MKCSLTVLAAVFVLFQLVNARGTIYLNEIQAIEDVITEISALPIECTLWDDNHLWLDNFYGIPAPGTGGGHGVDVDGVLLTDGYWIFPGDFNVAEDVTVYGLLQVNGGWFADDGDVLDANGDGLDFGFSVEDDTGNVKIAGTLDLFGGINDKIHKLNERGSFIVEDNTGETFIYGLLSPNGGINVKDGVFLVAAEGSVFTQGDLYVEKDLILGDGTSDVQNLEQYSNDPGISPFNGGNTTIQGQNGRLFGGNLVFSPGVPIGTEHRQFPGKVVLGVDRDNQDLFISRYDTEIGNAGAWIFNGQDSHGSGGDLLLAAGTSWNNNQGGDIVLAPGKGDGGWGRVLLGDPLDGPNVPYHVVRPPVTGSEIAGDTYYYGQDTINALAGDTYLVAGDGSAGAGNIYLEPGLANARSGRIVWGNRGATSPENIFISHTQDPNPIDAAPTWWIGQDSTGGDGGSLFFAAGLGSEEKHGDIYLLNGVRLGSQQTRNILWGTNEFGPDLYVVRPPTTAKDAHDTFFTGQDSTGDFPGGDLLLEGGTGFYGGNLGLAGADGKFGSGGDVIITANQFDNIAGNSFGGRVGPIASDIFILAGDGNNGGSVSFTAGTSGAGNLGGNIFIESGRGAAGFGDVNFSFATSFYLDSVPLFIRGVGGDVGFTSILLDNTFSSNTLEISPLDSTNGFLRYTEYNGFTSNLLRERATITLPQWVDPYQNVLRATQQLLGVVDELQTTLIYHGLIFASTVDPPLVDTDSLNYYEYYSFSSKKTTTSDR